jgi:hypothetical protein
MSAGNTRKVFALWFARRFALWFALRFALRFAAHPTPTRRLWLAGAGFGGLAFFDISNRTGNSL